MSAIAFDMIFIDTLKLTAFFRPIFVNLVPINTRKVALSKHLIFFNYIRVLKVAKRIVCIDKISEVLIITHRE
jgi:hypothetical protein